MSEIWIEKTTKCNFQIVIETAEIHTRMHTHMEATPSHSLRHSHNLYSNYLVSLTKGHSKMHGYWMQLTVLPLQKHH